MKPPLKRSFRRRRTGTLARPNPGSAPGLLQHNPLSHPTQLMVIAYGPEGYLEHPCQSVEDVERFMTVWPVVWVNVTGLADIELIEKLGTLFNLDRLLLEDVLDTSHRPKVEFYDNFVFTILKGGVLGDQFESEQISLFLKKNVVLVFQERPSHSFEQVRDRIRRGTGKIRHAGTDYLYYALIDEIIDRYFPILDRINHLQAQIEEHMVVANGPDQEIIQQIHHSKSDLLLLHRTIWPISDIIGMLMREDSELITKSTRSFLRDCYDHAVQANELTQFYRDTASGLLNTFLAYEGHKTNETVRVLTVFTAIFIPLNLIASIYGMNFHHMSELEWEWGYPFALSLMLCVAATTLYVFRRKGWIRRKPRRPVETASH